MLGDSEGKTTNNNLIKKSVIIESEVSSFNQPSHHDKTDNAKNNSAEIIDDEIADDIEENKEDADKVAVEIADDKKVIVHNEKQFTFNKEDALLGVEEANNSIKNLYDEIFGYGDKFKPTYKETLGDLLSYLGALSVRLKGEDAFEELFKTNPKVFAEKYFNDTYIPYAVKIGAWANKNKGKNNVYNILNGIIQTVFALAYKVEDIDREERVIKELSAIVDFIEKQGIDVNNK